MGLSKGSELAQHPPLSMPLYATWARARGLLDFTGPIGGDGYGRFWIRREGGPRIILRANRYALAVSLGGQPWNPWCARCTAGTTLGVPTGSLSGAWWPGPWRFPPRRLQLQALSGFGAYVLAQVAGN